MYGKVTKYFHDRKFGFIRGEDGNTYFIHSGKSIVNIDCPENGMSHRKREIKEMSVKVEVVFSGNESIVR